VPYTTAWNQSMSSLSTNLALFLLASAAGAGGWYTFFSAPSRPTPVTPSVRENPDVEPTPQIRAGFQPDEGPARPKSIRGQRLDPAPKPIGARDLVAGAGYIGLPDGTFMPNLNGVTTSDRLKWGRGPFPEIIGTTRGADGIEWYVLEGGDKLTTVHMPGRNEHGEKVHRDLIIHDRVEKPLPVFDPGKLIPPKK
jgi:hypothetical protein